MIFLYQLAFSLHPYLFLTPSLHSYLSLCNNKNNNNRNCAEVKIKPLQPIEQASPTNTFQQCKDTSYSYYEATEDCTGYVYCMTGGAIDGPYDCGKNMLYDTNTQRCDWEEKVTSCSSSKEVAEPGVPTSPPTPKPTSKNILLEWEPVPRPHDKVIIGYCECMHY